jgi:hypothetical protein
MLLTQNFFSANLFYKCVMDDESYFTVDGNECQQQSYYESEDHAATDVVKFIRNTKFPAKVLLWLAVRKRPTDTADRKILVELEKEGLQQQLSSKRCKMLDGKDQKRAEVH